MTDEHAGAGHKLSSFLFPAPVSGRYLLETTVDGSRIKRTVTLRFGHTVRAELIQAV